MPETAINEATILRDPEIRAWLDTLGVTKALKISCLLDMLEFSRTDGMSVEDRLICMTVTEALLGEPVEWLESAPRKDRRGFVPKDNSIRVKYPWVLEDFAPRFSKVPAAPPVLSLVEEEFEA